MTTFAMGSHERLGADSHILSLEQDHLFLISECYWEINDNL